jgi:hypothetical protein
MPYAIGLVVLGNSFVHSHSMDPHKVTEPYGCRNKETVIIWLQQSYVWTNSLSHGTIAVPSVDQLKCEKPEPLSHIHVHK